MSGWPAARARTSNVSGCRIYSVEIHARPHPSPSSVAKGEARMGVGGRLRRVGPLPPRRGSRAIRMSMWKCARQKEAAAGSPSPWGERWREGEGDSGKPKARSMCSAHPLKMSRNQKKPYAPGCIARVPLLNGSNSRKRPNLYSASHFHSRRWSKYNQQRRS